MTGIQSPQVSVVAFDAYGTLFDVHAVADRLEELWPDHGASLSRSLRAKQLEYSFLRGLMGAWRPFREVTAAALSWSLAAQGLEAGADRVERVMAAYDETAAHPGATAALTGVRAHGARAVILTNGSVDMVSRAVAAAGFEPHLDAVLSVDAIRRFKPDPAVYAMVADATGAPAAATMLVSANAFDVAGAATFGMQTCWVDREGALFDELGVRPDHVVSSLAEVPALLMPGADQARSD